MSKHNGSSIKELRELHHLSGSSSILNLQNVQHAGDAMEVNLKDKWSLSKLVLRWGHDNYNSENERNVHEELRLDTKLESLTIEHYGGTRFSNWFDACSLSNMVTI